MAEVTGKKGKYIVKPDYDGYDDAYATSKNEFFNLGEYTDEIYFDLSDGKKIGKNTVIYNTDETLTLYFSGNETTHRVSPAYINGNVVLEVRNEDKLLGTITLKGKTSTTLPTKLKIQFENPGGDSQDKTYIGSTYDEEIDKYIYTFNPNATNGSFAIGNPAKRKAQKINGTFMSETISGGLKNDKIYTGHGNDIVSGGAGNDLIVVNGVGNKTIKMAETDGNDTIQGTFFDDVEQSITVDSTDEAPTITHYAIKKQGLDLILTGLDEQNKEVQTLTLKDYSHFVVNSAYENLNFKGQTIDQLADGKTVEVSSTTVGKLLSSGFLASSLLGSDDEYTNLTLAKLLKMYKIKVPSALKKINVFAGTEYNDSMTGTNGKDVMISFGGKGNTFTTGAKGQTVIASIKATTRLDIDGDEHIASDCDDTYDVTSFTAGTVIVDTGSTKGTVGGKGDNLTIRGVDTNDIHLAMYDLMDYVAPESENLVSNLIKEAKQAVQKIAYFTDTKGVKNIEGINYNGIFNGVMSSIAKMERKGSYAPLVNYALKKVSSIISKFRGVAIAAGNAKAFDDVGENATGEPTEINPTMLDEDINIVDTDGNNQKISASSMNKFYELEKDKIDAFLKSVPSYYEGKTEEKAPSLMQLAMYLVTGEDTAGMTKKEKKAAAVRYKAIKKDFFNVFKSMFIGTSGDNTYTITKDLMNGAIVSGTGNDSFTFKGALANKNTVTDYEIVSSFGDNNDVDAINFKNYSFDDHSLSALATITKVGGKAYLNEINFSASDYKNQAFAGVKYAIGDDGSGIEFSDNNHFSGLTISDSKNTYNLFTGYSAVETNQIYNLSPDEGYNTFRITDHKIETVNSNANHNVINHSYLDATSGNRSAFTYNYGGGSDIVYSLSDYSDDIYKIGALTKDTKLFIQDMGTNGTDTDQLKIENISNIGDARLFFNVNRDGAVGNMNIVHKDNMKKANFILASTEDDRDIYADKGISFNSAQVENSGIDKIYLNTTEFSVGFMKNQIQTSVVAWLNSAGHDKYADVSDVLAKGSKSEINQVLAIYDKEFVYLS